MAGFRKRRRAAVDAELADSEMISSAPGLDVGVSLSHALGMTRSRGVRARSGPLTERLVPISFRTGAVDDGTLPA